ncbi:hypothetical protein VAS14_02406 [Photobacterium angustum S14]|nr:hypothetical protein VAS14_02406 [Photobacterium angustum S14]
MFGRKRIETENKALKQELADLKVKYQADITALEEKLQETQQLIQST